MPKTVLEQVIKQPFIQLWTPSNASIKQSAMARFADCASQQSGLKFPDYASLWQWSIDDREAFWSLLCEFFQLNFCQRRSQVLDESDGMFMAKWFKDSELNFAENLLSYRDDNSAIEFSNELGEQQQLSYKQLYQQVSLLSQALQQHGLTRGDRVAAVLPNIPQAIIGMLACTSIGAIWSSCSPDFGKQSLSDRFRQIKPKVLLFADGYYYKGKAHASWDKIEILLQTLDSLEFAINIPYLAAPIQSKQAAKPIYQWDKLLADFDPNQSIKFSSLPFNHPLYILYSSGTTGVPKCIVHGAGGTLLQHIKELGLHSNLQRQDKIFYYTSTGWMMWNWLVSSLALGATVVLYDGCPTYPQEDSLLSFLEQQKISIFGCSAKYISALESAQIDSIKTRDLSTLRCILSTGSPLSSELFDYVYQHIKKDLQLCSISGGTDLISCFALANPMLPVYRGELQAAGLGMSVAVYSEQGLPVQQQKGELVCNKAFPSMPIYFWNDPDNHKYHQAYFNKFPGVWTHGDYAESIPHHLNPIGNHNKNQSRNQSTPHDNPSHNGLIIYGRSDTTLNPGGIRIGTAEIYTQVEQFTEIVDSLVIGQRWLEDQRIILFVQLAPDLNLDARLITDLTNHIQINTSIHHVPAKIIQVSDIPHTYNGKLAELAVYQTIHDLPVKNKAALVNPESLDLYQNIKELQ